MASAGWPEANRMGAAWFFRSVISSGDLGQMGIQNLQAFVNRQRRISFQNSMRNRRVVGMPEHERLERVTGVGGVGFAADSLSSAGPDRSPLPGWSKNF